MFHAFQLPWAQLATITWSGAAQNNRPKKSSAVGILTCLAPVSILSGEYVPMIIVSWESSKAPREVLGSNGSEVQAGNHDRRGPPLPGLLRLAGGSWVSTYKGFASCPFFTTGAVVMDSKGIFDAMTRNTSSLHGLRSSCAGYELTISVKQAMPLEVGCWDRAVG